MKATSIILNKTVLLVLFVRAIAAKFFLPGTALAPSVPKIRMWARVLSLLLSACLLGVCDSFLVGSARAVCTSRVPPVSAQFFTGNFDRQAERERQAKLSRSATDAKPNVLGLGVIATGAVGLPVTFLIALYLSGAHPQF